MSKFCNFKLFVPEELCSGAAKFLNDDDKLLGFLIDAYNGYVIKHSEANLSLITNPDALFRSKEEYQAFIGEFKQYIRDVMGLPNKEDSENGNNRSHSASSTAPKNTRP